MLCEIDMKNIVIISFLLIFNTSAFSDSTTNLVVDKHKDNEYRHSFLSFVYNAWTSFLYSDYPGDLQQIQIARREFLRQTVILDRRRKENFLEVNPQYNEWFKELHATLPNYDDPKTFFEDRYEGWEKKDYIPNTTHSNEDLI